MMLLHAKDYHHLLRTSIQSFSSFLSMSNPALNPITGVCFIQTLLVITVFHISLKTEPQSKVYIKVIYLGSNLLGQKLWKEGVKKKRKYINMTC